MKERAIICYMDCVSVPSATLGLNTKCDLIFGRLQQSKFSQYNRNVQKSRFQILPKTK